MSNRQVQKWNSAPKSETFIPIHEIFIVFVESEQYKDAI